MSRQYLASVAKDTQQYTKDVVHKFPDISKYSVTNTKHFNDHYEVAKLNKNENKYKESKESAKVEILNMDTIDCALAAKKNKLNPLVLNMASFQHPGGGWLHGSLAQEEELFRRSTYAISLNQPRILEKYNLTIMAGIYSPQVIIFRGSGADDYYMFNWDDCVALDFIAVPALKRPKLEFEDGKYKLSKKDKDITYNKFKLIFETAIYYGNDSLILGAAGNGAYGNPPEDTAQIFKSLIKEYEKYFKYIAFAILTDHNDKYGNLKTYKQIIKPPQHL